MQTVQGTFHCCVFYYKHFASSHSLPLQQLYTQTLHRYLSVSLTRFFFSFLATQKRSTKQRTLGIIHRHRRAYGKYAAMYMFIHCLFRLWYDYGISYVFLDPRAGRDSLVMPGTHTRAHMRTVTVMCTHNTHTHTLSLTQVVIYIGEQSVLLSLPLGLSV